MAVRQRLVTHRVSRDDDRAADDADYRVAEGMECGHQGHGDRGSSAPRDYDRRGGGELERQAARQDRADATGARSSDARGPHRPSYERQGYRGGLVGAG